MEDLSSQGKIFFNRLLDPKAIIFGFAVLQFLIVLMYVIRYQQEFSVVTTHWNPVRVMFEPVLLLLAAGALLPDKLWGYLIAIVASGRVIYVVGYLGLFAISAAHVHPLFSWYVLRTWLVVTYQSQPQYLIELILAALIAGYSIMLCAYRLFSRGHSAK